MKTTRHYLVATVAGVITLLFLSQCKQNEEASTTSPAVIDTDTLAIVEDTVVLEVIDTIVEPPAAGKPSEPKLVKTKKVVIEKRAPLTLIIENLKSPTAPVIVGLYGTENKFPDAADQLKEYTFTPKGNALTAHITNLKFGTYAIALYQDENSNGKIDKNFIGMPTEGYAFSQNFKPTVKAPNFGQCSFVYNAKEHRLNIKMIR